ncbi:GNAT family N-acetyltransferase [Brevibacterium litoralis]|uniref:GNAT family N-acetyltransferase n=1 Tax=Brevibacterium litoralis TaxID=3138935 RepID=UPI0032EE02E0
MSDTSIDPADVEVRENTAESRYDILVAGEPAGFSMYLPTTTKAGAKQRILYHTVVHEHFGGHGLADPLTREAIRDSIGNGYRVVALCSYVRKWITKHHDFDEHLDPVTSEHLALVD